MSDRTIGILGLGIFGSSVLAALAKHDINIIAIDDHEELINQFEPVLVRGVVGDITDEELLLSAVIRLWSQLVKTWSLVFLRLCIARIWEYQLLLLRSKVIQQKKYLKKSVQTLLFRQSMKWVVH